MGIIKEPLEIDFFVDPTPLTNEEEQKVREYIKADKGIRKKVKPTIKKRRRTDKKSNTKNQYN